MLHSDPASSSDRVALRFNSPNEGAPEFQGARTALQIRRGTLSAAIPRMWRVTVKLRELLRKIDLKLRPLQLGGRPEDNVDAMTTGHGAENPAGFGDTLAPTNWVPSQQDDRPRH